MIQLMRSELRKPQFRAAITKISECSKLDTKVAYNFMRLIRVIDKLSHEVMVGFNDFVAEHVETDAEGKFLLNDEMNEFRWKSGVDGDSAKKALHEFGTGQLDTGRETFTLDDLAPVGLTVLDLEAIEPLFTIH